MLTDDRAGLPCPCAELSGLQRRLLGFPIPLNGARATDLEALPGIGPMRAASIVAERSRAGRFRNVAELERVPGLGPRTLARIGPYLITGPPDPACAR